MKFIVEDTIEELPPVPPIVYVEPTPVPPDPTYTVYVTLLAG
jgi:hypothetical protein